MNEFDLIRQYFQRKALPPWVHLGIGDDAAVLAASPHRESVLCSDTLIAGRHFPLNTAPADIGWKALAVNLSDLAAMGAMPRSFLLNLSLPEVDAGFLEGFASGLFELADQHEMALIGGDTTRGPLSITICAQGDIEPGQAMRRDTAKPGDRLVLVGDLGGAAWALKQGRKASASARQRLDRPQAFVHQGHLLARYARCAIDVSDGLAADLQHVLEASDCGAQLYLDDLPLHRDLRNQPLEQARALALHGGDDYALLTALEASAWEALQAQLPPEMHADFNCIGRIVDAQGIVAIDRTGLESPIAAQGYRHF